MIAVPKGIKWPPVKKDADKIYSDMLGLGCQLRKCTLKLCDGVSIEVKMPIEQPIAAKEFHKTDLPELSNIKFS